MLTADQIITLLNLEPLPHEGGSFKEMYRARDIIVANRDSGPTPRAASTQIYYLLRQGETSALHKVRSDEVFHHYMGDPVHQLIIRESETAGQPKLETHEQVLSPNLEEGHRPQLLAPADMWQGCCLLADSPGLKHTPTHGYALLGCTVAPGFEWEDFELITQPHAKKLADQLPDHTDLINLLTPTQGRTRA